MIAREKVVTIEVGDDCTEYHLHPTLLAHHSDFFSEALQKPDELASRRPIVLEGTHPAVFDTFVSWIYAAKLHDHGYHEFHAFGPNDLKIHPLDDDYVTTCLVQAYVLGHTLLAQSFKAECLRHLANRVIRVPKRTRYYAATYAFEHLDEEDVVLKLFVDVHCKYWTVRSREPDSTETQRRAMLPQAFLLRMTDKYAEKVQHGLRWFDEEVLDPCDYHGHVTREEWMSCVDATGFAKDE